MAESPLGTRVLLQQGFALHCFECNVAITMWILRCGQFQGEAYCHLLKFRIREASALWSVKFTQHLQKKNQFLPTKTPPAQDELFHVDGQTDTAELRRTIRDLAKVFNKGAGRIWTGLIWTGLIWIRTRRFSELTVWNTNTMHSLSLLLCIKYPLHMFRPYIRPSSGGS